MGRGLCYMGNDRALAVCTDATYAINVKSGNWTRLSEASWYHACGLCCLYLKTDETYYMLSRIPDIESVCDDRRLNELVKCFREHSLTNTSSMNKLRDKDLGELGLNVGEKIFFR